MQLIYPPDTYEEIELKREIAKIEAEARLKAQPLFDRLAEIAGTKMPIYYMPDAEEAESLEAMLPSALRHE